MARITLHVSETTADHLPMICMVCGSPATQHVRKSFDWRPEWLSVLALLVCVFGTPLVVVILVLFFALGKRMKVDVPTCDRHPSYWLKRYVILYAPLAMLFALVFAQAILLLVFDLGKEIDWLGVSCFGAGALFIVWLIVAAIGQQAMIRAATITDRSITLVKVSDEFHTALKALREQDDLVDADPENRARRRRIDVELDDDRPPRTGDERFRAKLREERHRRRPPSEED